MSHLPWALGCVCLFSSSNEDLLERIVFFANLHVSVVLNRKPVLCCDIAKKGTWRCLQRERAAHGIQEIALRLLSGGTGTSWNGQGGCPWDERTFSETAGGEHLDILKWTQNNGSLWDDETCTQAAGVQGFGHSNKGTKQRVSLEV